MSQKIIFRFHAVKRIFERKISEADVLSVVRAGKVIENYPDDNPYPSCLKLSYPSGRPIHVVVAEDTAEQTTIVITVYEPDINNWEAGFEKRKKP